MVLSINLLYGSIIKAREGIIYGNMVSNDECNYDIYKIYLEGFFNNISG